MSARCKSCDAEIEWYVTERDKRIPLDVGDFPDGNLTVHPGGLVKARTDEDDRLRRPARRSHFATCPQGDMWRRT